MAVNLMKFVQSLAVQVDVYKRQGYDPLYASAFEKKNASYLGMGVVFNKFTGSRGKSGSDVYKRQVFKLANTYQVQTIVDPKGADWSKYDGATCITPVSYTHLDVYKRQGRRQL